MRYLTIISLVFMSTSIAMAADWQHDCRGNGVSLTFQESNQPSLTFQNQAGQSFTLDNDVVYIAEEIHGTGAMLSAHDRIIEIFMNFPRPEKQNTQKYTYNSDIYVGYPRSGYDPGHDMEKILVHCSARLL